MVSPPPGVSSALIVPPIASVNPLATRQARARPRWWRPGRRAAGTARRPTPRRPWAARAVVDDPQLDLAACALAAHRDRLAGGAVAGSGVVHDVGHHPLQQPGVGQHRRQLGSSTSTRHRRRRPPRTSARRDDLVVGRPGAAAGSTAPVASRRRVQQVVHQARSSRSADSSTVASSSAVSSVGQIEVGGAQAADRGLDRRQRGAQVVPDGGEQRGAQLGGLGRGAGPARLRRPSAAGAGPAAPGRRRPPAPAGRRRAAPGRAARGARRR